jgi:hypothetical protein
MMGGRRSSFLEWVQTGAIRTQVVHLTQSASGRKLRTVTIKSAGGRYISKLQVWEAAASFRPVC